MFLKQFEYSRQQGYYPIWRSVFSWFSRFMDNYNCNCYVPRSIYFHLLHIFKSVSLNTFILSFTRLLDFRILNPIFHFRTNSRISSIQFFSIAYYVLYSFICYFSANPIFLSFSSCHFRFSFYPSISSNFPCRLFVSYTF